MKERLESLDILRGFDMFFIFLPDPALCICFVALAAFGLGDTALAQQFDHVHGDGLHFYDLIFPLFLFMSGVSWPFSRASKLRRGESKAKISLTILKRAVLLFVLGAMVQTKIDGVQEYAFMACEWEHFRVWSVIGRIGIAWGVAAFLTLYLGPRPRLAIIGAIMLVMWWINLCHYDWAKYIDTNFLTTRHCPEGGFVTINMIPTAMLGIFAGEVLCRREASPMKRFGMLSAYAAVALALGLAVAFAFGDWSLPVNKGRWSTSFVLVAGGISFALMALFYYIVDIRGWRKWGFFFKVIGMNSITIYVLVRTVLNYDFLRMYFFGGLAKYLRPEWCELVAQIGLIAMLWYFLYWLYRKEIFLRV